MYMFLHFQILYVLEVIKGYDVFAICVTPSNLRHNLGCKDILDK